MDLLEQLALPFPKECHKSRRIPGGSYYIYVPWDHYVDRLNQLLGLNWSVTYTDPITTGDYLTIRAQLTITTEAGVTIREGAGTGKIYPEKNEDGKEKIIGDPPNNALRESFRDACYQFGLGKYLDNQRAVCTYLGVKDAEELSNKNGRLKQQGEISREEWEQRRKPKSTSASRVAQG